MSMVQVAKPVLGYLLINIQNSERFKSVVVIFTSKHCFAVYIVYIEQQSIQWWHCKVFIILCTKAELQVWSQSKNILIGNVDVKL